MLALDYLPKRFKRLMRAISYIPEVIFCSFGDMLRVPGNESKNLRSLKAQGGDVRIIYSPLDAVKIVLQNLDRQVVFLQSGLKLLFQLLQ
jgi:hydrogenase expression/formation protein HypD